MRSHLDTMVLERNQLDDKIAKLDVFLAGDDVMKLDVVDRGLLHQQYKAMCYYQSILHQRIDRIK